MQKWEPNVGIEPRAGATMKMTEIAFTGAQPPIDGYAPGGFRVGGAFSDGALLLAPSGAKMWTAKRVSAELTDEDATALVLFAHQVDVLLIGTGDNRTALPCCFVAALERAGIRFDAMSTGAACRTYNVLLTEDRRAALAALPLSGAASDAGR